MPPHVKAASPRRVAIGGGKTVVGGARSGQQAVVAERDVEAILPQRADRVADVVANSVGGVDQRVVPVGVEERGERMRGVMIGEEYFGLRTEAVLGKEPVGAEKTRRIRCVVTGTDVREIALEPLVSQHLPRLVIEFPHRGKTEIVQREDTVNGGNRVNVPARPARDVQNLIDGEPRNVVAPAFFAPEALLRNRRDETIVLEGGRRGAVQAGLERKNMHSGIKNG